MKLEPISPLYGYLLKVQREQLDTKPAGIFFDPGDRIHARVTDCGSNSTSVRSPWLTLIQTYVALLPSSSCL